MKLQEQTNVLSWLILDLRNAHRLASQLIEDDTLTPHLASMRDTLATMVVDMEKVQQAIRGYLDKDGAES